MNDLTPEDEREILQAMQEDEAKQNRLERENAVLRQFVKQPGGEKAFRRALHDREYGRELHNFLFG